MNPPRALIGFGQVRHRRLRPVGNAFSYPTCFLMLPMRHLRTHGSDPLAVNRPGLLSFHDRDHGDGRDAKIGGALAWLDGLLHDAGIRDATGEAWLQTYPRVLGHTFKPVSFWYCHTERGELRAIVVEVNNTFGERHCYLLAQTSSSTCRPSAARKASTASASCVPTVMTANTSSHGSTTTMQAAR